MADNPETTSNIVELAADIVAAYVTKNHLQKDELPALIATVHEALQSAATGVSTTEPTRPEPVVPPNKSVRPDYIVCLFDGKKFKSLKRHLRTNHNMTPQEYRAAFNLRPDYPMVAPAYASARSELAKTMGLGRKDPNAPAEPPPGSEASSEPASEGGKAPSKRKPKTVAKAGSGGARKSAKAPVKKKAKRKREAS